MWPSCCPRAQETLAGPAGAGASLHECPLHRGPRRPGLHAPHLPQQPPGGQRHGCPRLPPAVLLQGHVAKAHSDLPPTRATAGTDGRTEVPGLSHSAAGEADGGTGRTRATYVNRLSIRRRLVTASMMRFLRFSSRYVLCGLSWPGPCLPALWEPLLSWRTRQVAQPGRRCRGTCPQDSCSQPSGRESRAGPLRGSSRGSWPRVISWPRNRAQRPLQRPQCPPLELSVHQGGQGQLFTEDPMGFVSSTCSTASSVPSPSCRGDQGSARPRSRLVTEPGTCVQFLRKHWTGGRGRL